METKNKKEPEKANVTETIQEQPQEATADEQSGGTKEKKGRKVERKTYEVRDVMDWLFQFRTPYPELPFITVHFTGGQINGYGVAPARFTTDEPLIQRYIENTKWFKNNRITLVNPKTKDTDAGKN